MKTQRIRTNIIELSELREIPCERWLKRFENGKIDAHEVFKRYGSEYSFLYKNSNYDLIGWEIDNEVFDWMKNSWFVARYCPEKLDPERYNWELDSWAVAMYCPEKLDPEKYNWKKYSFNVAIYCPENLDPEKYNWKYDSWAVAQYCPEHLDKKKYNWWKYRLAIVKFCKKLLKLNTKKN